MSGVDSGWTLLKSTRLMPAGLGGWGTLLELTDVCREQSI